MHIDQAQKGVQSFVYECDINNTLLSIQPESDPDVVPNHIPMMVFSFIPTPYKKIFDEFIMEWSFWYDNPDISKISIIIDELDRQNGQWNDIHYRNKVISRMQINFIKSPLTGGAHNLKFITLFIRSRFIFYEDAC